MFYYTTQGIYLKKNIEGFADTDNSTNSCDSRIKQMSSDFDTKFNEQKNELIKSNKDLLNEKDECIRKIAEINKQFQSERKLTENTIKQLFADKEGLNKKIEGQKSCDLLIKQSYADFEKQYQSQKDTYEVKIKEQKEITEKTMKQFLTEKEDWTKQFDSQKIELTKSLEQEKNKLENTKKTFEEKIKKLESAIAEITLDIKKI